MPELNLRSTRFLAAAALTLLALLSGCRVGPPYQAPAPPAVTAPNYKESTVNFHDTDGWKVASPQDAMIRGNWWEVFNDPELNALEEQLNIDNQNLKEYFQNYMAARAVIVEARAQYWPTITANPAWSRSRTSANQRVSSTATTGTSTGLWNLPIDVSWTPDFWGKIRNEVHEAQYAAQVSAADLQIEKLTEQASLAEYFFEIRGQDMLQKILDETVAADQKSLDYTQAQYDTGVGDYISVAEAKTTLESAEAAATNVGLLRAQYEHAIATLLGKIPTDLSIPVKPMLYTPPPIPTGVPSQLIERRPDIAAAERTLAEANAAIGIGYGAFFPQVTLSASGGLESATFTHLFDIASRTWSVGPSVSQVLFNGWLYRAELNQYVAAYNADLATYRQDVLNAFQQVEDTLVATRVYSQQILRQQAAVKDSQDYLNLELVRYNTGVDPYVDVVIAQTTLLSNQETLNALQVEEMTSAVQLVQALGGGWDRTQLPTPAQAGAKTTKADYTLQQ
jgi:NodT family efflux transporter outer membrane factor (OMF) lipoprotein